MPEHIRREFEKLKAVVSQEEGTAGNRIDDLGADFERLIAPLKRYGRADPEDRRKDRILAPNGRTLEGARLQAG